MSPNILKRLEKYSPGKVKMVCNYPIVSDRLNEKDLTKEEFLKNGNKFIYSGTVYDFSEQESILEALDDINCAESKYIVVGKTPNYRKESMLASRGANKLELIPWIEKTKLLDLYRSSSCGIVIFKYTPVCCNHEGQMGSNKIFEYMLEGLPVICTDFELWRELIIDKYHCGICVNPDSKDEIKRAIKFVIEHKEEAYEMGKRARKAVLKEFNWDTQAGKYVNIMSDLCDLKQ